MLPAPIAIPSARREFQSVCMLWQAWILVFFVTQTQASHTCDPFFRHPVSNEAHLQLPCLIFHHRSQHFFYGLCGVKPSHFSLTHCHCGKIIFVMKVNWKWVDEVVTGAKRVHMFFSFSVQCPFLMEGLPLSELIHGHLLRLTYPGLCDIIFS